MCSLSLSIYIYIYVYIESGFVVEETLTTSSARSKNLRNSESRVERLGGPPVEHGIMVGSKPRLSKSYSVNWAQLQLQLWPKL